jgi:isoaspartyl peptidase/L-asparaginase-like protein (Ntn-hydrolase superfamily)
VNYVILTHGGATPPQRTEDHCIEAAEAAREVLAGGGDALAAALAATLALEDDPVSGAGAGSSLPHPGGAIEMDAAIMNSDGRFGAVTCIEEVKNPILIAAKVMETPHLLLAGAGATAFARRLGLPEHPSATREMRAVGAVLRDRHGRFAAAASTGGSASALRGRVGAAPLIGAGVYAGPYGAVSATGAGEEIARRLLAKTVHDWLAEGIAPARAAQRAVAMFPEITEFGLLVVGRSGQAIAGNRNMTSAQILG